ncbi:hypothetical protein PAAG_06095 [Paracoccidioides lutzii Pb01]|uniref:PH-like domain-containing protein n=1 Tax=Paracoccidioides lutzii (strain ATCC MYA-826 / Pb01) TaxID=502779 RepID=C1H5Y5_PARBA|nr:hypothetical protein PAAG_06095 [Paracoccidioides lutzii Pb01]EEH35048.2 hypothetical protein PAAG_06095 [Paracoccidioides lutzii Pb01]
MAISDETASSRRKSSLEELVAYLRRAIGRLTENNLLIIPLDIVKVFLGSLDSLEGAGFSDLVALFDGENKGNCSRLDLVSFHCMLHILLRAPPCLARERGFYLFLKSMRDLTDGIQKSPHYTVVVASRQRKSLIGQKTFHHLLDTFVGGNNHRLRKWSGQLILELISRSNDSRGLLGLGTENNIRKLGEMVLDEMDYILRLLAAVLIQEMVASQLDPRIFWPQDTPQATIDLFSIRSTVDRTWIQKFNNFVAHRELKQNKKAARMQIARDINVGESKVGPSNCLIGVLVSNILTIMISEDNRFQFMDIRLGLIDKLVLYEKNAILDVYLHPNCCYMTNGLLEKADIVSVKYESQPEATEIRDILEQKRLSVKKVTGGAKGTKDFPVTGASAKKARQASADAHLLRRMDNSWGPSTLGCSAATHTARNLERKRSHGTMIFTSEGEAIRCSSAHLDLSLSDNHNENSNEGSQGESDRGAAEQVDKDAPSVLKNHSTIEGELWGSSNPSRVGETPAPEHPAASTLNNQEKQTQSPQIALNAAIPVKAQATSCNGEPSSIISCVVQPHGISQSEGDCLIGLPSLARQALQLQLQPQNSNSSPDMLGQDRQARESSPDLGGLALEQTSFVAAKPIADPEQLPEVENEYSGFRDTNHGPTNSTRMGQPVHVSTKETAKIAKSQNVTEMPNQIGNNSKLKRPHNRISESTGYKLVVDWDQDLRVDDIPKDRPETCSKKPRKTPPQTKGPGRADKSKSVSSSAGKKSQQGALQLTPCIESTPRNKPSSEKKCKAKRSGRQVTKTLTSARQPRAAAERANQKLALANEYENATYDFDDPIESSLPEEAVLVGSRTNKPADTDITQPVLTYEQNLAPDDVQGEPLRSIEGLVNTKGGTPTSEEVSDLVLSENVGSKQTTGNVKNVPRFLLTRQDDTDNHLYFQRSYPQTREQSHPIHAEGVEIQPKTNIHRQKVAFERKETSLGKRLSEALVKAGILSSNTLKTGNGVGNESNRNPLLDQGEINDMEAHPRTGISQISKSVSQFISRQVIAGQRTSVVEQDKEGCSGIPLTDNEESSSKSVKPNVDAEQGPSEESGNDHEAQTIQPTRKGQSKTSTELHKILKPATTKFDKIGVNSGVPSPNEVVVRKVQIVCFNPNGPKNHCAIPGSQAGQNSEQNDANRNETHKIGDPNPVKNGLDTRPDAEISDIDDLDEVSLIPTSDCLGLAIDGHTSGLISQTYSSSIYELTATEFLSQGRVVQMIPTHNQLVDENGSPQPLHRDLWRNRATTLVTSKIELPSDTPETSQSSELSVASSREDSGVDHIGSISSDSDSNDGYLGVRDLNENRVSYHNTHSETPPQRKDTSSKKTGRDFRSLEVRDSPDPDSKAFWRRSAPSTFAERLRGKQEQTRRNKKSSRNSKVQKSPPRLNKAYRKSNIMSLVESSSDISDDGENSEADKSIVKSGVWCRAEVSAGSSSSLSDTLVEEYRAVESEWQNALRATLKTGLDILLDASSRLVRHLLDEEEAIDRVVDTYKKGGARLIDQLEQRYVQELQDSEVILQPIKQELIWSLEGMLAGLDNNRRSLSKQPALKDLSAAVHKRKKFTGQLDAVIKEYEMRI